MHRGVHLHYLHSQSYCFHSCYDLPPPHLLSLHFSSFCRVCFPIRVSLLLLLSRDIVPLSCFRLPLFSLFPPTYLLYIVIMYDKSLNINFRRKQYPEPQTCISTVAKGIFDTGDGHQVTCASYETSSAQPPHEVHRHRILSSPFLTSCFHSIPERELRAGRVRPRLPEALSLFFFG